MTEGAARYRILRFGPTQVADGVRGALAAAGVDLSRAV